MNHYEFLGLNSSATKLEVKTKYKALSSKIHPDKNGSTELFKLVKASYEVINAGLGLNDAGIYNSNTCSDPALKDKYDHAVLTGSYFEHRCDTLTSLNQKISKELTDLTFMAAAQKQQITAQEDVINALTAKLPNKGQTSNNAYSLQTNEKVVACVGAVIIGAIILVAI